MTNRVKPVVPMSIEDHDKEVMKAWNDGRVSEFTEDYTCEFCADGTDEYGKSLFREELKLGNASIADVDVYIGSEDNIEMLITNSTDEVIAKQVKKIKYCPMCDRKLGGTE